MTNPPTKPDISEEDIKPCLCVDVELGSYDNQVVLKVPDSVVIRRNTPERERSDIVCADSCIAGEVYSLWQKGIATTGCCCGHNKVGGYIGVEDEHIERMKRLGYEVRPNHLYPDRQDSFKPKTTQALQTLITKKVNEAMIDELERADPVLINQNLGNKQAWRDRIAELKAIKCLCVDDAFKTSRTLCEIHRLFLIPQKTQQQN